jgi:anti-anti-sigma factor
MRYNLERTATTPPRPNGIRPDALSFMIDKRIHPARLAVAGEIDLATCESLVDAVYDAMTADVNALDVDASGVTFCSAAGISAFVTVLQHAQEQGKTLRLVNLNSWTERVLTVTGLLVDFTTPPQDAPSRQTASLPGREKPGDEGDRRDRDEWCPPAPGPHDIHRPPNGQGPGMAAGHAGSLCPH